jgi:hypothetical protein
MSFIPQGALVAGSPQNSLPRRPDRELPGEQVILKGFWIDKFPYPNEEGAIALTSVSEPEAQALCNKQGKRLCTELEWERACKGPNNTKYAWGERYRAEACQLGSVILARPAGLKVGCHSEFDVFDLHGGVLEWTSSPWHRGNAQDLFVLKGGNGIDGELIGRCANVENAPPNQRSQTIGFRCCSGPTNTAEVSIELSSSDVLERVDRIDTPQFQRIVVRVSDTGEKPLPVTSLIPERAYIWHPVNNERLQLFVACTRGVPQRRCGLLVGRDTPGQPTSLAFADTGVIPSAIHMDYRAEDIWLLGLDTLGSFKRLVRYQAGLIFVGPKERRIPKAKNAKSGRHRAGKINSLN